MYGLTCDSMRTHNNPAFSEGRKQIQSLLQLSLNSVMCIQLLRFWHVFLQRFSLGVKIRHSLRNTIRFKIVYYIHFLSQIISNFNPYRRYVKKRSKNGRGSFFGSFLNRFLNRFWIVFGSFFGSFLICFLDHFWIVFWIIFGSFIRSFLDRFWIVFGLFLDRFWIVFGSFLDRFWIFFGLFFGSFLGRFLIVF